MHNISRAAVIRSILTLALIGFAVPALAHAQTAPAVVKNIKTDFGATCNGVADDSQAFVNFNTWATTVSGLDVLAQLRSTRPTD